MIKRDRRNRIIVPKWPIFAVIIVAVMCAGVGVGIIESRTTPAWPRLALLWIVGVVVIVSLFTYLENRGGK